MIYLFTVTLGLLCILHFFVVLGNIEPCNVEVQHNVMRKALSGLPQPTRGPIQENEYKFRHQHKKLDRIAFMRTLNSLCTGKRIIPSIDPEEKIKVDKYNRMKNHSFIQTNFGDIKGQIEIFNEEEAAVFYSIRYAKPPTGLLRFRKPEPIDEATKEMYGLQANEKVACVQPKNFLISDNLKVSEDCLHLNIWVPLAKRTVENAKRDTSHLLPVMIWIHGGSFHIGSGNQDHYNGIVLSTLGKVIVVTLNYRLGFFGFLNAEVECASGNMGLYDQAAALKWVKENIESFEGDPNKITVFGESAGGMSVALLTVSPITKHLFNRAIIESGSPYSPLRPEPKAEVFKKSLVFSKALNCSYPDAKVFTQSSLKCLLDLDYKVIDDYGRNELMHSQILANPLFGDEFIPANVHILMNNPETVNRNLEVLLGITKDEGFLFVAQPLLHLLGSAGSKVITKEDAYEVVQKILKGRPVNSTEVSDYYFQNKSSIGDSMTVLNTISALYGDLYINCPVYYLANRYKEIVDQQNIYSYMLTKASSRQLIPICKDWSKICHGDEIQLIFGAPLKEPQQFDESDRAFSEQLIHLWTEFAKTGKVPWSSYANNWFVELPLGNTLTSHPEVTETCEAFWRELFENQMESYIST